MPSTDIEAIRKSRREWYARNKEHAKAKIYERRAEMKAWYNSLKTACPCGEDHPACLQWHHRDPEQKELSLALVIGYGWSKERILKEIEKCDLLCANCHAKLHYEERMSVV